ncbi:Protein STB5 [Colletotrichum higginsianum]|uniref:Protein STB5 n=1 Tax=Colletotrichum higginsianum TaxID=80884 RepID=A0A4T0W2S6_9PEZI|nr:Protein STB5 [Colletotrichum higginsianum]
MLETKTKGFLEPFKPFRDVECVPRHQDITSSTELSHSSVIGYVESLKKRVAELKHNVQSSSRKRARTENHRAESSADGPLLAEPVSTRAQDAVSVVSSHASARTATRRGHEDSSVRATMGAIGFLSRSAMAEPRGQSDELPRKFSLGEIISGALAIDGRDPSKASPAPKTPTIDGHLLPLTHDATSSHLRRFLDSIVFLPYLDEASLLEQYDIVVANNDRPDRGGRINPLHFFNVHMALAIGILMSPDSAHLSMLSSGYHAVAANQVHSILRSEVSLEHVHCMVMLLLYSLLSSTGGSAWHLLGLTVKTCISLGLHREPDAHADLTMAEANKRRWLFWTVYSLDRSLSIAMDRPFSIQDDDISVQVPPEEEDAAVPVQHISRKLHLSRDILLWNAHDVEMDAIGTSEQFVDRCYARFAQGGFTGTFIDAYDIFHAAVVCVCLAWRMSQQPPAERRLTKVTGTLHKASTLVTAIASRFPALASFQRVLLALSTCVMGEKHSDFNMITSEAFSPMIPRRIQQFIRYTFT